MTLFQHQLTGASWLSERPKAYLGDEPGLGKTRTIIRGMRAAGVQKPLIVCPAIVRTHWHREGYADAQEFGGEDFPIMSYDQIVRGGYPLMKELLTSGVDALVLDEAHYAKHSTSQRTKILLGKDGYARRLERVWLASGTPQPKHPGELWTMLSSVFPEVVLRYGIKTAEQWKQKFCIVRSRFIRGEYREKVVGAQNVELLQEILHQVMLRRTLKDVGLDVPQIWWQQMRVDADVAGIPIGDIDTYRLIERTVDRARELESIAADPHVARMRRRLGELKVAPVAEILASQLADSNEKIVVFAHHTSVLHSLRELLGNFDPAYIDGDTAHRDEEIDRFANDPRCRVFIGQNQAVGTGTDGLQKSGAHRAIFVEPDWTAANNVQLAKRLARIGGKVERVIAQFVTLSGTLDEGIVAQNIRESAIAADVFGTEGVRV